jgi:lysophospholipase L1-like esterase
VPTKLQIVAIGDSLTQGFQSGAIEASKSQWSYPAIIARSLGLDVPLDFRVPRIPGPGLPVNIEALLHDVAGRVGNSVGTGEWIFRFPFLARRYLDEVEDYYERGGGQLPAKFRGIHQNLGVWGFTVREGLSLTPARCREVIDDEEGFLEDDFLGVPSGPMYRTAMRVINPGNSAERMRDSQVATFERLAATDEAIDVLLLGLGANDCLGTVLTLDIRDMTKSAKPVTDDPIARLKWNLTSAKQFELDYRELANRIQRALSGRETKVFVSTVPHVTIPPITTGVGEFDGTYFDGYARFFVNDHNRPRHAEQLSRQDAKLIDERIDGFNRVISDEAELRGWHVVDVCALLDRLAVKRRQFERGLTTAEQKYDPEEPLRSYLAQQPDHPLLRLRPVPSILSLRLDAAGKRTQGGLFSLDGVHPTTIGYGLMAEAFLVAMRDAGVPGADPARLPWDDVIANDSLLNDPPRIWDDVVRAAEEHAFLWDLVFRVLA